MTVLVTDDFATDLSKWTRFEGAASPTVSGGVLHGGVGTTSSIKVTTPAITIADSRIVVKFNWGATAGALSMLMLSRVAGSGAFTTGIQVWIRGDTGEIEILKRVSSVSTSMAAASFTPSVSTAYWGELITLGNTVLFSVYSADPRTGSPTPLARALWNITGADIAAVGAAVTGGAGLRQTGSTGQSTVTLDDYTVDDAPSLPALTPSNTAAPQISTDGSPATGETIQCDHGTWDNSPTGYTWQFRRGASNISGASGTFSGSTPASYDLQAADEGLSITCRVTATNGAGSATADSNAIVPTAPAPLVSTDITYLLSGGGGNANPNASFGGAPGAVVGAPPDNIFDRVIGSVATAGRPEEYRCVYVHNGHGTFSVDVVVYLAQQLESASMRLAIGAAVEAAGATAASTGSILTAPSGVAFSAPTVPEDGVVLGTLAPGQSRGLWVQRVIDAGTLSGPSNPYQIAAEVTQL